MITPAGHYSTPQRSKQYLCASRGNLRIVEVKASGLSDNRNRQVFREMATRQRQGLVVFIAALFVRAVAAVITTFTTLNPDSTADARGFVRVASIIAGNIMQGQLTTPGAGYIYDLWGSFLAPFWLLPGPSGLYARLGNALLAAFAIYNVYLIARTYHSHQAGVLAALPMIFYPSFVAVHSTVLREAIVLFGITTATRLLVVSSRYYSRRLTYPLAGVTLYIAYIMRADNVVICVAAIAAALAAHAIERTSNPSRSVSIGTALSVAGFVLALPLVRDGIKRLARIRDMRAFGRTVYLPDVVPRTVLELLAFSWIGAAYFLYAPFPWMIETVPDLLVSVEGLVNIGFTIAAVWGVHWLAQREFPITVGLLIGLIVAVTLYGVGTANYGTGMRHRQMFLWVIFLFGAIGLSERIVFRTPAMQHRENTRPSESD
ncbi:glycosyltransferase family 39 protein [Haloarcula amylolytica]|uniref:glycosyltransferase family 39 protein n=1 Tax=Haloarcula amylolytica TaxID=396317 RepID=UPI003C759062